MLGLTNQKIRSPVCCGLTREYFYDLTIEETPQAERLGEILYQLYQPASVLDVGCATGLYIKPFLSRGVPAYGIDNNKEALAAAVVPSDRILLRDATEHIPSSRRQFDLTLCLEVAEHISEDLADQLVNNLCTSADTIVFSAAQPGQSGNGHVNCQPPKYWIGKFAKRGYQIDHNTTKTIVQFMRQGPHMGWLPQNLIVFTKKIKFRFHLLGLAHIPTHRDVSACAYSQKVLKLSKMLMNLGHTVMVYGGEGSDVDCSEFVQVVSNADRVACYGDYDWHSEFFKHDGKDNAHLTFNENAIREINLRKQERDFLLCPMGNYQKPIADAVDLTTVEPGIGYSGVFSKHRVFESYAWMHYVYGLLRQVDGSWYDAVIPNYFDPVDFPFRGDKEDYFLYMGRLVLRKGLDVAVQVTRRLGVPLIVAGQGNLINPTEHLNITDSHVTHVGCVGPEERARLMGGAKAVFVPTYYIEPFGGVAVEAQMCGTPVITTDWGVFNETCLHGITGFRCRTFADFIWAAQNICQLKPENCRQWAMENYSLERIQWMYQLYFNNLYDLWDGGWYKKHPERQELSWLERYYPCQC